LKAGVTTLDICIILVSLQVIVAVSVKITVFWVVKPYCLAEVHKSFGGTSFRNLQCRTFIKSVQRHILLRVYSKH